LVWKRCCSVTRVCVPEIYSNYGAPNITSPDPFPIYYPRTIANDPQTAWNFNSWIPDVVVINLGANDFSTEPQPPRDVFEPGYVSFIHYVLSQYSQNPNLKLFLACGPVVKDPCCEYVEQVSQKVNATFINMQNILDFPSDYGCDGHPNVRFVQSMFLKLP
jgi:hypothetical protein